MWAWMLNDQYGIINVILVNLHLIDHKIAWTASTDTAMIAVLIVDIWKTTPFMALLCLAGLQMVPRDIYEAARIDGVHPVKVFFKIALPQGVAGLAATFVFGLILTWNEFLFALLLSGPDTRTVPVAMNQAVSSGGRGTDWTLLAAIETLFLIPVFLVTFFLQTHLLRGVTFGTVKR